MTWWAAHQSAKTNLCRNCHEPANRVPILTKSTGCARDSEHWSWERNNECTQSPPGFTEVTWHSSPLPRTSLRCHRTCLGGTRELWPLTRSPCGHFWKRGGPAQPALVPLDGPEIKQCTLLPFTQINSENTAFRITRRDARVEWELFWHLIQIAASCKELFLSFVSICLRKVPSAAYKCANSPFKETQPRTARSSLALPT